jgi:hypothetical protein
MRFLALALLLALPQQSATITITTADDVRSAKSIAIKEIAGKLCVEYEPLTGSKAEVLPCSDVVEIAIGTPAAPVVTPASVEVITTAGDSIFGTLGDAGNDSINLANTGLGKTSLPFSSVDQVRFLANRSTWPSKPGTPRERSSDAVHTTSADTRKGTLLAFSGTTGIEIYSAALKKNVTVGLGNVAIACFAATKDTNIPEPPKSLYSVLLLTDGSSLQGMISSFTGGTLTFTDLYKVTRTVPAASVAGIYHKNGRVVYLSDVAPSSRDENSNYIRAEKPQPSDTSFPAKFDRSVLGDPIKIRGTSFRKGVGVHAHSSLTWTLSKQFAKFQATIGIDDGATRDARDIGNVTFKVLVDGKEVFDSGAITSKDKPRAISVDVDGAAAITLVVTFGTDDLSQGDIADWALARVIRAG